MRNNNKIKYFTTTVDNSSDLLAPGPIHINDDKSPALLVTGPLNINDDKSPALLVGPLNINDDKSPDLLDPGQTNL